MKAMEKIKLSKERVGLIAELQAGSLKGLAKIKASKRVVEIVVLLGGSSTGAPTVAPSAGQRDLLKESKPIKAKIDAAKTREAALKIAVAAVKKDPEMHKYMSLALRDYVLDKGRENYILDFPKPPAKKYLSQIDVSKEFKRLRKVTDETPFRIVGTGDNGSIEISVYDSKDRKSYDFFIMRPYQDESGDFSPAFGKNSWIADALAQWFSGNPVTGLISPTKHPKWDRLNLENTFLEALAGREDDAEGMGSGGGSATDTPSDEDTGDGAGEPTNEATSDPNAVYQSVLDGADITRDLILQVRAEGQKDPDHPQLRPAVRVIVETVKAMAA